MSENTAIEWADHTFNPWIGCTKVSPACANCYAETYAHRYGRAEWGPGRPRSRTSPANWRKPLKWNREAEKTGARPRVFCASLADVFDVEVPVEWREDLWRLIWETGNLDWLLLTKRIEEALAWFERKMREDTELPPNIWIGTTVEDQKRADERIPVLLQIPAKVRFLSMEPLLGPVDLWGMNVKTDDRACTTGAVTGWPGHGVDWVIAGGESGPGARPSHPDWFRSIRDECAAAGVPFLFKQWGAFVPCDVPSLHGGHVVAPSGHYSTTDGVVHPDEIAPQALMHRYAKKEAGRLLDGVEHNGFPSMGDKRGG